MSGFVGNDPIDSFDQDGMTPYAFDPEAPSTWILPETGKWSASPGNSRWYPSKNSDAYVLTGGKPIQWVKGTPNFKSFVRTPEISGIKLPGTVKIDYTGDASKDRRLVIQELAKKTGLKQREVIAALRVDDIRIHHYYEGEMQLVPRELNEISHAGLASALRARTVKPTGMLLRGGGVVLKHVGFAAIITDPVGVLAGPTTPLADTTISGTHYRAEDMIDSPEEYDTTDVAWALKYEYTGLTIGAMNDPANFNIYVDNLLNKSIQFGIINAPSISITAQKATTHLSTIP